jgi:hypothetical protein
MRRTLAAVAVVVATLAPAAAAKGVISGVELCGADGCEAIATPRGLHEWPGGAGPSAAPPPVSPFFEVRFRVGARRESRWYVPAARRFASNQYGSIRWSGVWQWIDQVIARAAEARAPRRVEAVTARVDGRRIAGDASGLFRIDAAAGRVGGTFVEVRVQTLPHSPWAVDPLWFYPKTGALQRGTELVTLPSAVAADLRGGRPIGASPPDRFDWPLVSGFAAVSIAAGGLWLVRRARHPR